MEVFNDFVADEDLKKFERKYYDQLEQKNITRQTKFEYAWCLVRSIYPGDIKKGILLLEELCKEKCNEKRDYLYYLAVGNARIKEYTQALHYCEKFLEIEPSNKQVQDLESVIKSNMDKEAVVGMTITAGVAMVVAALVGVGVAFSKRK